MNDFPRSCAGCAYWSPSSEGIGICRRHAPGALSSSGARNSGSTAFWPSTLDRDWCGEWQPRNAPLVEFESLYQHEPLRQQESLSPQEPAVKSEEERDLRNASIAEALLALPAEKRDMLLLEILTEEERQCPAPPNDFYERVQDYFARQRDQAADKD